MCKECKEIRNISVEPKISKYYTINSINNKKRINNTYQIKAYIKFNNKNLISN